MRRMYGDSIARDCLNQRRGGISARSRRDLGRDLGACSAFLRTAPLGSSSDQLSNSRRLRSLRCDSRQSQIFHVDSSGVREEKVHAIDHGHAFMRRARKDGIPNMMSYRTWPHAWYSR